MGFLSSKSKKNGLKSNQSFSIKDSTKNQENAVNIEGNRIE